MKKQRFSAIIVKCMEITHMNVGRDSIIGARKVKISETSHITKPILLIISSIECNVVQASPCDIWYLDSGYSHHMT
jgi:hypothetical protein